MEFMASGVSFVVIENNPDRVEECRQLGIFCIEGDASSDDVLMTAGIKRAKGLVAAVDNDADNVFVTLSARVLNPNINIVARSILEASREKLMRAGANRVVTPSLIGGKRMASIMLRPLVTDYLDVVTFGEGLQFRLEELIVGRGSGAKGHSLGDIDIRKNTGALILAVRRSTGEFNTNPSADTVLAEGDNLVVLGTQDQLDAVRAYV
jgi:voltage-gated potassium channel